MFNTLVVYPHTLGAPRSVYRGLSRLLFAKPRCLRFYQVFICPSQCALVDDSATHSDPSAILPGANPCNTPQNPDLVFAESDCALSALRLDHCVARASVPLHRTPPCRPLSPSVMPGKPVGSTANFPWSLTSVTSSDGPTLVLGKSEQRLFQHLIILTGL
jgi:hypothetical protein